MSLLLNPKTWIAGLAALFILFFVYTMKENDSLKQKLDDQQEVVAQLVVDNKSLKEGQLILLNDVSRLDTLAASKQTIIIRENQLDRDLDAIPETDDRPFADDNNFAYGQRLRSYQTESLDALTANNNQ